MQGQKQADFWCFYFSASFPAVLYFIQFFTFKAEFKSKAKKNVLQYLLNYIGTLLKFHLWKLVFFLTGHRHTPYNPQRWCLYWNGQLDKIGLWVVIDINCNTFSYVGSMRFKASPYFKENTIVTFVTKTCSSAQVWLRYIFSCS